MDKAVFIQNSPNNKLSDLYSNEIKDLVVLWCYYSGKIEGNTYSYVETEALLKDGITSIKSYDDAKMLKNLYNTFVSILEIIKKESKFEITEFHIKSIHSSLTDGLPEDRQRGMFRTLPVRINGTSYQPLKDEELIKEEFNNILERQELYSNPLEKAVYAHCNFARLQPFLDGNKRTARMIESIILMNSNLIPVYSSKEEDILAYRKGLVGYYESCSYTQYTEYFLNKQIARINEISEGNDQYKGYCG
ncbi:cell division protein [Bacteroidia bacterium]|nr:cell division protein [Bacteroidia bacterium]